MSTFFDDTAQERRQNLTRRLGLRSGVVAKGAKNKPKPARFPVEYGAYLEECARRAGLDRHEIGRRADLSYQAVYRNFEGKPERSLLAAAAIRDVIIKAGVDVAPVPVGDDPWQPPSTESSRPGLSAEAEILRRNLIRFREEAGYPDLHEGSRATGIPFDTLRSYELGDKDVSGAHLLELARVYGRNPTHFEMDSPPPAARPPHDLHFRVVAPLEDLSPENRARVEALQREVVELKKALLKDAEERRTPSKRKPSKRE